jgi:rhamnose transport system permease protein
MTIHRPEVVLALVIAAILAVLAAAAPRFYEPANLRDILLANLPVLVAAVGATLVILTGEIDISVGSIFAICSVLAGTIAALGSPLALVAGGAIAAGAVLGAVNGVLVGYARIPSIVVTLAAMVALRDGLRWTTEGAWVIGLPATFQWLGLSRETFPYVAAAGAALLTTAVGGALRHTRGGRAILATGSQPEAARLASIDVAAVRFAVFVAAGLCTGLAAVVNTARFTQVPSNTGLGLEMKVIAAVIVGGAVITGGRGSMRGTVLGVTLLAISGPALTFLGASAYWERALQGAIILAAVASLGRSRARAGMRRPAHA